jgi:hypothetical protein
MAGTKKSNNTKRKARSVDDRTTSANGKRRQGTSPTSGGIIRENTGVTGVVATATPEMTRSAAPVMSNPNALYFNSSNSRQITPPNLPGVGSVEVVHGGTVDKEKASKQWLEACQKSGRLGSSEMLAHDLSQYVRYDLFSKLKFIMSDKQLNYSRMNGSFCMLICNAMGLGGDDEVSISWWETYKETILVVLNNKRADVTAAIKRAFLRKYKSITIRLLIDY